MIIVSTDGSCLRNPGGAIGWAWVNHEGPKASGSAAVGTNQIAELRAVLEAILAHSGDQPLLIESDSQYAIKCASEWLPGWKRKNWRTAAGAEVKNLELIQRLDKAISEREGPVRFRWVRGHVGNYFNEMADTLAGEAARSVGAEPEVVPVAELATVPEVATVPQQTPAAAQPVLAAAPPQAMTLF